MSITKQELVDLLRAQTDIGLKTKVLLDLLYSMPTAYIDMIVEEFYYTKVHRGPYYRCHNRLTKETRYFATKEDLRAYQFSQGAMRGTYIYKQYGVYEVQKYN